VVVDVHHRSEEKDSGTRRCDLRLIQACGRCLHLTRPRRAAPLFRPLGGLPPFVFLTALSDRENELRARRLGADDYVDDELLPALIGTSR
jgi:CheY-like chemotaxis protein